MDTLVLTCKLFSVVRGDVERSRCASWEALGGGRCLAVHI